MSVAVYDPLLHTPCDCLSDWVTVSVCVRAHFSICIYLSLLQFKIRCESDKDSTRIKSTVSIRFERTELSCVWLFPCRLLPFLWFFFYSYTQVFPFRRRVKLYTKTVLLIRAKWNYIHTYIYFDRQCGYLFSVLLFIFSYIRWLSHTALKCT